MKQGIRNKTTKQKQKSRQQEKALKQNKIYIYEKIKKDSKNLLNWFMMTKNNKNININKYSVCRRKWIKKRFSLSNNGLKKTFFFFIFYTTKIKIK